MPTLPRTGLPPLTRMPATGWKISAPSMAALQMLMFCCEAMMSGWLHAEYGVWAVRDRGAASAAARNITERRIDDSTKRFASR